MALVEGGNWKCYNHNFETPSLDEWNSHCTSLPHFEFGHTNCIRCGSRIEFSNLPFVPLDKSGRKNISLHCDECVESAAKK